MPVKKYGNTCETDVPKIKNQFLVGGKHQGDECALSRRINRCVHLALRIDYATRSGYSGAANTQTLYPFIRGVHFDFLFMFLLLLVVRAKYPSGYFGLEDLVLTIISAS